MVDFMYLYDLSDPFCRVAEKEKKDKKSEGSNKSLGSMEDKMGEIEADEDRSPEKIDIPEDELPKDTEDNLTEFEGGSIGPQQQSSTYSENISFPSLEEALNIPLDIDGITNI